MSRIVPKTNKARNLVENCIVNFNKVNVNSYMYIVYQQYHRSQNYHTSFVKYIIINCPHSLNIAFQSGRVTSDRLIC